MISLHVGRFTQIILCPVFAVLCYCATARAATTVDSTQIQTTNTQAMIPVVTDQPGTCSYVISELQDLSAPVNDVNPALFPGANSDGRLGSVINNQNHYFVAGLRRAAPGVDGKFYGRALAANTLHYGTVSCGNDAAVPFQFTTQNIALGDTFTDALPFDSRGLGNYAIPSFDFTDLTKSYIDQQTGFKFKLITGPGQMPENSTVLYGALKLSTNAGNVEGEAYGLGWNNPSAALIADGSSATYSTAAQDVLTIRLAAGCPFGDCSGYDWSNVNGTGSGYHSTNIDAYQLALTGNGTSAPVAVDVALSWNGTSQGSDWQTITLPAAPGTVTYPLSVAPGFAAWQGQSFPLIPGMYWQTVQQKTTVNTNSVTVTWAGGAHFSLDPRILTTGSRILINGIEYIVASVDSATQVTLTTSAGNQTNATAYLANFSVMIRKHAPTPGTLNIDGAKVTITFSNSFSNGGSGFMSACSHLTSTDSTGNTGRFCIFQSHQGESGVFWVANDLTSRFIGRAFLPASSVGTPADEYLGGFYTGQSLFDTTDPNSWWMSATLVQGGHSTMVRATYNPSGAAGCTQTADYRTLPPSASYDAGSVSSCNITYTELTRPSQGKDVYTQIGKVSQIPISGKMGNGCNLSFVQNGHAIFLCTNQQDAEGWIVTVNLATGLVKGVWSTYMNTPHSSCRGCVLHAVGPSTPTDNMFFLGFNNYFGGPSSGLGPYNLTINTPLSATPSLTVAACQSLVTDPSVAWLLQYSDGCDNVSYAGTDGIPCDPDPSTWEAANVPACSWHAGWTQWQAGAAQIGDWFQDPITGYELFVIGAKSGNTLTLLRNVNVPNGPQMAVNMGIIGNYLRAHPAGWSAGIWCSFQGNAFVNVAQETDGTGMIWDRKFFNFNHSVFRSTGIISAEYYNDVGFGQSVRMGNYPTAANRGETARVLNTASFAGKLGLAGLNFLQSHPGWDGNPLSFTDMAPMAGSAGGNFSLWPQPGVVNIGGNLYKIPAASVFIPIDKKRPATAVWSGLYNFVDISGIGAIAGTNSDAYRYCSIDYPGATCGQPNENVGDIFLNIPQATIDGQSGGTYDLNRVNAVPLGQEPLAALQYYYSQLKPGNTQNTGAWERRLTTGFGRYNGQDTYSNSKVLFNSNILLFNCSTPNLQRIGDICAGQMPPDPPLTSGGRQTVNRSNYISVPLTNVPQGATYVEAQFGYAEYGAPGSYQCTSREEACNTSSPAGTPFNFEGETRTLSNCAGGCTIPALPGHIVYYRVRTSSDGKVWANGPMQVAASY